MVSYVGSLHIISECWKPRFACLYKVVPESVCVARQRYYIGRTHSWNKSVKAYVWVNK